MRVVSGSGVSVRLWGVCLALGCLSSSGVSQPSSRCWDQHSRPGNGPHLHGDAAQA